mmetsp:Transcript_7206/g.11490  ORF Transcript_7206/g.11490 Transcript_7206/m.11490 type:complete len:97 (+) Transcript_7206:78-368(+)
MPVPKGRNLATAVGLVGFVAGVGSIPYFYTKHMSDKNINLLQQEKPLSGSQIIRGAYMNTGSKDIGVDPDWDFKTRTWRGRRSTVKPDIESNSEQE